MIIVMRTGASTAEIDDVKQAVADEGLETYVMVGEERIVMGVVGVGVERVQHVESMSGVEQCIRVSKPYKLASSEHHPDRSSVRVGGVEIGAGAPIAVIAGPCAVESREQLLATARWVKREGATLLRGGAFKPRSSPYAFQGLGVEGLRLLAEARDETGLPVVSEITDPADVEVFDQYVDMLQIGEIERDFHEALSTKDIELMMSLWSQNATFTAGPGKTAVGRQQIQQFWLKSTAFKPSTEWVSDHPAYKLRVTVSGDRGTLHFECHFVDVKTREVEEVTAADMDVVRIDGRWLITNMVGGTAELST